MKIRALIADDSGLMRRVLLPLSAQSRLPQFSFTETEDVPEAMARFEAGEVDALFLDCGMPNVSASDIVRTALAEAEDQLCILVLARKSVLASVSGDHEGEPRPAAQTEAATLPDDSDLDLLNVYTVESLDHLEKAEAALLDMETDPENTEFLDVVFRAFHTIKGTSGFLGLDWIQRLAHLTESLLQRARDGDIRLTGDNADLCLASCDLLKTMVKDLEGVGPGEALPIPEGYAELLGRLESSESAPSKERAIMDHAQEQTGVPPVKEAEGPAADVSTIAQAATAKRTRPTDDATARVSTRRLDSLINMVGELVISHSMISEDPLVVRDGNARLQRNVTRAAKISRELQDLTMGLRMVPLTSTFQKMRRLVRDLARKSGKSVQLVTEGEDTEIDRNMVDSLGDPLVHMIRNAVDHGIEPADERRERGKSETGTIALRAYHSGASVVIEVADDGRGLDRRKILARAIDRNLATPRADMSASEVLALTFQPGLSTAEEVTDVSGRGVGLDVVRKRVEALHGRVEVASRPGEGSTFTLWLPLTMAITDGMLLRVGAQRYLLPTVSILESFRPTPGDVTTVVGRGEMVALRGKMLPVFRLQQLFNVEGAATEATEGILVVIDAHGRRCALLVDELLGQQQAVIKSLGKGLAQVRGVSGGTILGDGRVGLVLDAGGIIDLVQTRAPGNGLTRASSDRVGQARQPVGSFSSQSE